MFGLKTLFSVSGRITRRGFVLGFLAAIAILAVGIFGSFQLLAPLSAYLSPIGINAGLIQTGIFVVLLALVIWMVIALLAKRMRDMGAPAIIAPLAVLPLAAVAVADGLITIRPLLELDPVTRNIVYLVCGGVTLVAILFAIVLPSRT